MRSMTGFGRASLQLGKRAMRLEMRSVNNRFLDIKLHLPWADGAVEQKLRHAMRRRLTRGRVDVSVSAGAEGGSGGLSLNRPLAADLRGVLSDLSRALGCDLATAAALLPTQRELVVLDVESSDSDRLWADLGPCVEAALDELIAMREREGQALGEDLRKALVALRGLHGELRRRTAHEPASRGKKLRERVEKLCGDVSLDADRVAQEIALLADRCDVSEELVRLESHFAQLEQMFEDAETVGRKIEFLLQEVNRELNTIASKTGDGEVAKGVVEAKGWLEKMREQAQNVE